MSSLTTNCVTLAKQDLSLTGRRAVQRPRPGGDESRATDLAMLVPAIMMFLLHGHVVAGLSGFCAMHVAVSPELVGPVGHIAVQ